MDGMFNPGAGQAGAVEMGGMGGAGSINYGGAPNAGGVFGVNQGGAAPSKDPPVVSGVMYNASGLPSGNAYGGNMYPGGGGAPVVYAAAV